MTNWVITRATAATTKGWKEADDRIQDKIFMEAQHASLNPKKEMPGLIPGSLSRPADVFIENWVDGRKVAFDISVVSPVQDAILHRAADTAAAAIEMRKASKTRDHANNCRAQGIFFQPLVVVVVVVIQVESFLGDLNRI